MTLKGRIRALGKALPGDGGEGHIPDLVFIEPERDEDGNETGGWIARERYFIGVNTRTGRASDIRSNTVRISDPDDYKLPATRKEVHIFTADFAD